MAWEAIGTVQHSPTSWQYSLTSPRLDDLHEYAFRVVPIDAAGNDGTAVAISSEMIVRVPDSPMFSIAFSAGTLKVTFS